MWKILNGEELSLGTCYYPEHWDESLWESDLDRMLKNHIRTIRIAEFAWNKTEPREGEYTFDFFDRFLDLCEKKGMQVIFCTPTATAPAWMTEKYPEVLNKDINGLTIHHGERQQTNYNSPVYRAFSRKITEVLAEHYGQHPAIIGWQLDNEFNCGISVFYSESDTIAFRKFLEKKYESIDELNKAWGTVFWNQTYNSFEEIHVPRRTVNNSFNPHLLLDYYRFVMDSTAVFAKEQADIIRKYKKPDDFITTNGIFANTDYIRMGKESLDMLFYDSYPDFAFSAEQFDVNDQMKDRKWSRNLTEVRSYSPVFGIMEQQSGPCGWNTNMKAPVLRPGQINLWSMQSIAHGADYVGYFRWRTCTFGTEMYWRGILDFDNRDNRRLSEICALGDELKSMKEIAGSRYKASVAILNDFDNQLDEQIDAWHRETASYSRKTLFETLQKMHIPFDYYSLNDETDPDTLSKYDLLIYPHPYILNEKRTEILQKYVSAGGKVIFGCASGMKDMNGICPMTPMPGVIRDLTGVTVTEFTRVSPDEPVYMDFNGVKAEAPVYNDVLMNTSDTEVLAVYDTCFYKGMPAVTKHACGKGFSIYYGAAFSEAAIRELMALSGITAPYQKVIELPENMELCVREKDGKQYLFVLNYPKQAGKITIKTKLFDMIGQNEIVGDVEMPPMSYGVYRLSE